jgi:four helix bundle protein
MDRGFENLRVWQQSRIFVNSIYDIMEEIKDYGFRDQIQRAAVSIMNNIAEGAESGSDAKYVNFLQISRGSCSEVRSMLYLCLDRKIIDQSTFDHLKTEAVSISNQIYRLIESITKANQSKENGNMTNA